MRGRGHYGIKCEEFNYIIYLREERKQEDQ